MVFDIRSSGAAFAPAGARAPAPWPIALRTTGAQAPVLAPDGAPPAIPAVALSVLKLRPSGRSRTRTYRCSSSGRTLHLSVLSSGPSRVALAIGAQAPVALCTKLRCYRCSSSGSREPSHSTGTSHSGDSPTTQHSDIPMMQPATPQPLSCPESTPAAEPAIHSIPREGPR
jgi:hypothetical protein